MTSITYLAVVQVNIQSDSNEQLQPSKHTVKSNQYVEFVMQGSGRVVVTFDSARGSCLTKPDPFHLDGSDPSMARTGAIQVRHDAAGPYPFTVTPVTSSESGAYKKGPGDHEAKQGELDVSTDPEEYEEEKKKDKRG